MVYPPIEECLAVVEGIIQPYDDLGIVLLEVIKAVLEWRW